MKYPKIPSQIQGEHQDIVSMLCADTIELAIQNFKKVLLRFRAINDWNTYSDQVKTKFTLIDSETKLPTIELKQNNFIKIDIPGPGNPSGKGYDWTKIINIQNEIETRENPFAAITIRPCANPESEDDNVAHFYTEDSTNTFIVRRVGTCIYAEVHGRNQQENTDDLPVLDTIRNKAITVGANLGLGGLNWITFTNALLNPTKG